MTATRERVSPEVMLDVLAMIAEGHTNARIAREQGVSQDVAKWRVRVLLADIGARGRAHAVAIGYQRGYLPRPPAESR